MLTTSFLGRVGAAEHVIHEFAEVSGELGDFAIAVRGRIGAGRGNFFLVCDVIWGGHENFWLEKLELPGVLASGLVERCA